MALMKVGGSSTTRGQLHEHVACIQKGPRLGFVLCGHHLQLLKAIPRIPAFAFRSGSCKFCSLSCLHLGG